MIFIDTSPKSLIKDLEKAGFTYVRTSGSHVIYFKAGIGLISVPVHGNKDIPIGTFENLRKKLVLNKLAFSSRSI